MVFLTTLSQWVMAHKWAVLFYLVLIILIIIFRKKFQVENKFILLYRTKWGINFINKFADRYKEFVKIVGYSAIGLGFIGMIVICGYFVKGLYNLIFVPSAPPTLSLVIPGVQIPGSPIFFPLEYTLIALFIVVLFHEFGHGIVARAHGLKIKSTGIIFFGPLIGAFVEPDEKHIVKKDSVTQHSIFASGPFFNAILAVIVLLILSLILNPIITTMVDAKGVQFTSIQKGYAAEKYGINTSAVYTGLNGVNITDADALINSLSCVKPNETINLSTDNSTIALVTGANPTDTEKGYLGVSGIKTNYVLKSQALWFKGIYYILYFLTSLLEWVFMLSLGIGLANLLPLGPVDGGRMLHRALVDTKGKAKGVKIWVWVSIITLAIMIILIFTPIIKSVFFKM